MNWKIFTIMLISMVIMMMAAGCTTTPPATTPPNATTTVQTTSAGVAVPTGSSSAGTTVAAAGNDHSLIPGPTQTMPKGTEVYVQVNQKDPIARSITVIFNGGPGMNQVTGCTVHLIRSDGTEETQSLTTQTGSELVLKGTKDPDRIIVTVSTSSGKTYTIVDQMVALAPR